MKTTERFDRALTKLYTAFHEGTLNAFQCGACAVGNIVGHGYWRGSTFNNLFEHRDDYLKVCKTKIRLSGINNSGYSDLELTEVEYVFLKAWENDKCFYGTKKDTQFKGLCAVVEYLAELDRIPNPMDYTKFFEVEDGKPKYQLENVK